ncbi:MAG: fatty acid desaturase family protein [Planctomycetota bacterium]|jgi:linoleoyl-CoA desaturase
MSTTAKVTYGSSSEFQKALRSRVDRYFRMTGGSPRANWRMYVKTAVILGAAVVFYTALVFGTTVWWQAALLSLGLGVVIAAIGFNIQHDGGHEAYSRVGWVNRAMAFTLDLVGASSYVWARKHNVLHHTYTNVDGHDDDIDLGPLARFSPDQRRFRHHRLQHIYMWVLYAIIIPKWHFQDDWSQLFSGRIGSHKLPWPKGWDLVQFVAGKLAWLTLVFILPMMLHPIWAVLACYVIASGTAGIIVSIVFQLAHVVEETQFPTPDPVTGRIETPWAIHQVQTTADFAQGNRLLSWYVGGLNFQIEHHLFPRVCHVHYPKIARIVKKTCRQHGITYHTFPTVSSAVRSHYRWLREMGKPVRAA